jgi:6,7-dimethyl-8-ribityllumazine synthase
MGRNIGIVCVEFHRKEVSVMLEWGRATASENEMQVTDVVWVPGCLEAPLAIKRLLDREDIDGAVVLGIIEKGETEHGSVMGFTVTKALIDLQLSSGKPVGYGIIGPGAEPEHLQPRLIPHARKAVESVAQMLQ